MGGQRLRIRYLRVLKDLTQGQGKAAIVMFFMLWVPSLEKQLQYQMPHGSALY